MKRPIFILSLLCSLMIACSPQKKENQNTESAFPIELEKNPITDLMYYLEKNGEGGTLFWEITGGDYVTSKVTYDNRISLEKAGGLNSLSPETKAERDSILRAFNRASESGIRSYHTESHQNGIDTLLYAVALTELSGEKSSLKQDFEDGNIKYYNLRYEGAQVATLRSNSSPSAYFVRVEYATKHPSGKKREPFTLKYLKRELDRYVQLDSVKTYEVHYKYTDEEVRNSHSARVQATAMSWGESRQNGETRTWDGETRGHLYVVTPSQAGFVGKEMKRHIMSYCMGIQSHESYDLNMWGNESQWGWSIRSWVFSWDEPFEVMHLSYNCYNDDKLYILVIDKVEGAYALPGNWEYCITAVDGKRTYIPDTPDWVKR